MSDLPPSVTAHEYGLRVKETETHFIDVIPMLVNWRLHTIRKDGGPLAWSDRFWCYAGRGQVSLHRAVAAALAWDGSDETEPEGWSKNGQTGEWRELEGHGLR